MNDENKIDPKGLFIWFIAAIFFCYEFLLRTVVGTFEHPITYDLHLNLVQFSIISSVAYQLIYALMQIPAGLIVDSFGLKKALSTAAILCATAMFAFSKSGHFETALLYRLMIGLGSAFGFISILVIIYEWLPRKYTAFFVGLSQFIGTIGPMASAGPLTHLAHAGTLYWREIFMYLSGVGFVLAFLAFLFVKNKEQSLDEVVILKKPMSYTSQIKSLLYSQILWIALFSACIYFSIEYLSENATKQYLGYNGFSEINSAYMVTLSWLGYALGCPILGYISDILYTRKRIMQCCALLATFALLIIVYYPVNAVLLTSAFFMLGLGAAGQTIAFAAIAENAPRKYIGVALALNNSAMVFVMAVNAPIVSSIVEHLGGSRADYRTALTVLPLMAILAFIISTFCINETFCKSNREATILKKA